MNTHTEFSGFFLAPHHCCVSFCEIGFICGPTTGATAQTLRRQDELVQQYSVSSLVGKNTKDFTHEPSSVSS